MKKPEQNILAKNSNNEIAYLCGKCGKEIAKEAVICIHCGAKLGKIRCPFCNFIGSIDDFKYDTCPHCGRKNKTNSKNSNRQFKYNYKNITLSKKLFWILFFLLFSILVTLLIIFLYNFDFI